MPGCLYKLPDDYSVAAAQRIGEHVAVHEALECQNTIRETSQSALFTAPFAGETHVIESTAGAAVHASNTTPRSMNAGKVSRRKYAG